VHGTKKNSKKVTELNLKKNPTSFQTVTIIFRGISHKRNGDSLGWAKRCTFYSSIRHAFEAVQVKMMQFSPGDSENKD